MNWIDIRDNHTKAFNKLIEWQNLSINEDLLSSTYGTLGWYFTDGVHVVKMWSIFEIRKLYDFFDENDIIITPVFEIDEPTCFDYIIQGKGMERLMYEAVVYEKRINAEKAAFTRAFTILESNLTE